MKKLLILFLVFSTINISAQQRQRKLLRNEAAQSHINSRKHISGYNHGQRKKAQKSYRSGYSEVFLRIEERGYYTVEAGNQIMSNPHGKFRFFELPAGRTTLSVYKNGGLVYRSPISLPENSRMLLDFTYEGLFVLDIFPIDRHDDWLLPDPVVVVREMSPEQFRRFKGMIQKTANFDDDKMRMIDMQVNGETFFNTLQIRDLMNMFSFGSNKLNVAKKLYTHCVDKDNYFTLLDALTFLSEKKSLQNFIRRERDKE